MSISQLLPTIISLASGILIGVIGYFLKRTIGLVDTCTTRVGELERSKASKEDLLCLREETGKRIDKLAQDISDIKDDYITKEDFYREQGKTERKLDMILDILMERKGAKNG